MTRGSLKGLQKWWMRRRVGLLSDVRGSGRELGQGSGQQAKLLGDESRGQGLTGLVDGRWGKEWEVGIRPRSTVSGWWT